MVLLKSARGLSKKMANTRTRKNDNVLTTLGVLDARLAHVSCPCYQKPASTELVVVPATRQTGIGVSPELANSAVVQFPAGTDRSYLDGSVRIIANTGDIGSTVQVVSSTNEFSSVDLLPGELSFYYLLNSRWTGGRIGKQHDDFYSLSLTYTFINNVDWITLTLEDGSIPQMPQQTTWTIDALVGGRDVNDQSITMSYNLHGSMAWNALGTVSTLLAQSLNAIWNPPGNNYNIRLETNSTGGLLLQVQRNNANIRTVHWFAKLWLVNA